MTLTFNRFTPHILSHSTFGAKQVSEKPSNEEIQQQFCELMQRLSQTDSNSFTPDQPYISNGLFKRGDHSYTLVENGVDGAGKPSAIFRNITEVTVVKDGFTLQRREYSPYPTMGNSGGSTTYKLTNQGKPVSLSFPKRGGGIAKQDIGSKAPYVYELMQDFVKGAGEALK